MSESTNQQSPCSNLRSIDHLDASPLGAGYRLFSGWPRDTRLECSNDRIAAAIATSRHLIQSSRSSNTIDKYARDFAIFAYWAIEHRPDQPIIPTHPALLGIFIGDLTNRKKSKQRILSMIAAIKFANEVLGYDLQLGKGQIYQEIRGLRRTSGKQRQNQPTLREEEATSILAELGPPATLFDCRERAILALGWTSALRRSNIAALRVRDITIKFDGLNQNRYLEIFVAASKTDQERVGRYVTVTEMPGHHPLCAVRAIEEWIDQARIAHQPDTPLFRAFSLARVVRERTITAAGISGQAVNRTLKRMAKATGRDPKKIAAHALRRGFATSADEKGVRRSIIRDHGGWKSNAMIDLYTRVDQARDNAIAEMFGRKKQK